MKYDLNNCADVWRKKEDDEYACSMRMPGFDRNPLCALCGRHFIPNKPEHDVCKSCAHKYFESHKMTEACDLCNTYKVSYMENDRQWRTGSSGGFMGFVTMAWFWISFWVRGIIGNVVMAFISLWIAKTFTGSYTYLGAGFVTRPTTINDVNTTFAYFLIVLSIGWWMCFTMAWKEAHGDFGTGEPKPPLIKIHPWLAAVVVILMGWVIMDKAGETNARIWAQEQQELAAAMPAFGMQVDPSQVSTLPHSNMGLWIFFSVDMAIILYLALAQSDATESLISLLIPGAALYLAASCYVGMLVVATPIASVVLFGYWILAGGSSLSGAMYSKMFK